MAVLWEQKELVKEILSMEPEEAETHKFGAGAEAAKKMCMESIGVFWIAENVLVDRILKKRGKTFSDPIEVVRIKRVITASVNTDHFLMSKNNEDFGNKLKYDLINTSTRLVTIDPDKGTELLNPWYFWMKYIPTAMPPLSAVATSVAIGVISALVTFALTQSSSGTKDVHSIQEHSSITRLN